MEQLKGKGKIFMIFTGIMAGITALTCFLSVKNTYASTGEDDTSTLIISSSEDMPDTTKYVESDFEFGESGQTLAGKFLRVYSTVVAQSPQIDSEITDTTPTSRIIITFDDLDGVSVSVYFCGGLASLTAGKGIIIGNFKNELGAEGNYVDIYVNPGSEYTTDLGTLKLDERKYKAVSNGTIKVLTAPESDTVDGNVDDNSFNLGEWLNGAGDTVSDFLQSNLGVSVSGTVCIIAIAVIIASMFKRKR